VLAVKNGCGNRHYLANRVVELTRALFNWSAKTLDGKVNFWPVANPAKDVSFYEEKDRERFLQPDELVRFNAELENEEHCDLRDFLTLAIVTAARKENILSARWQDIQWERKTWTVPNSKNGEGYDVALLPTAIEVLKRRQAESLRDAIHIFPGRGKTGHVSDLKKKWARFRKRAQIPDVRIHDLRRTVGSYLAISGSNLPTIAQALGHKSLQSVSVYARLHEAAVRDARESGQTKMMEMMRAAQRRLKQSAKNPKTKLLAAAVSRG